MTDVEFVAAAYGAVVIGLGGYAVTVWGRLRRARRTSLRIRADADRATRGTAE